METMTVKEKKSEEKKQSLEVKRLPRKKLTPEQRQKILEEVKLGKTRNEIARKLGVNIKMVSRVKRLKVIEYICKKKTLENISRKLNMSVNRVMEIKDSYIESLLINGGEAS